MAKDKIEAVVEDEDVVMDVDTDEVASPIMKQRSSQGMAEEGAICSQGTKNLQ